MLHFSFVAQRPHKICILVKPLSTHIERFTFYIVSLHQVQVGIIDHSAAWLVFLSPVTMKITIVCDET
jgi:hypothetical protein